MFQAPCSSSSDRQSRYTAARPAGGATLRILAIVLAALGTSACATGQASGGPSAGDGLAPRAVSPAPQRVPVAEYMDFLDQLSADVENDEPRELSPMELERYQRINAQLRATLAGVENIDQLDQDRKIKVFNLHEELQAVLIGDPKYRVICRRERSVGTHFRHTTCTTVEEFRADQEHGRRWLQESFIKGRWPNITPPAGG